MNLPKKVNYMLFLFLIALAIMFRSGYIHQHGGDTWAACTKFITVSDMGGATWILHPLSFFGWYPLSYPSGEFFLLSALEQTGSLSVQLMAYTISALFGVFGIFSVYLLARQLKKDDLFAFIAAFNFTTFEQLINHTWNNLSTRGLFMVLYPIAILLLLKMYSDKKNRYSFLFMATVTTIAVLSLHRIAILFIGVILVPYIIAVIVNYSLIRANIKLQNEKVSFFIVAIIFAIFLLQIFGYSFVEYTYAQVERHQSHLFPEGNPLFRALNLAGDYGVNYNISVIFAPLGLFLVVFTPRKHIYKRFLILVSSFSIFFILDIKYFLYFFSPLVAIMGGLGIIWLFQTINKGDKTIFLSIALIAVLTSIKFLEWYITKGYYVLSLPWLVSFMLIVLGMKKTYEKIFQPQKIFFYSLVGFLLISVSFASAISNFKSLDLMAQAEKGEGKIANESRQYDSALWVKEYGSDGWVAEDAGIRLPIWAISRIPTAANELNISDNIPLRSELNPQFNLSLLKRLSSKKILYDYTNPYRFNPDYAERMVIYNNDTFFAERFHVNWVILFDAHLRDEKNYKGAEIKIAPFLKEERYPIYRDSMIVMFYYDSGK